MTKKFILIVRHGQILKRSVHRPSIPTPNLRKWVVSCEAVAAQSQASHFLFKYDRQWHVHKLGDDLPVKRFPGKNRTAAEMYLLMRAEKN